MSTFVTVGRVRSVEATVPNVDVRYRGLPGVPNVDTRHRGLGLAGEATVPNVEWAGSGSGGHGAELRRSVPWAGMQHSCVVKMITISSPYLLSNVLREFWWSNIAFPPGMVRTLADRFGDGQLFQLGSQLLAD